MQAAWAAQDTSRIRANAGCTAHEIMAALAPKTLAEGLMLPFRLGSLTPPVAWVRRWVAEVVLKKTNIIKYLWIDLAEREGFEPPIRLPVCRISSAVHSTTLPPLREGSCTCLGKAGRNERAA